MIITKNRNLLIFAAIAVTASITIGTFTSSYIQQTVSAQNQNSSNSAGVASLRNLTGSVQVLPRLSQIIQSKANISFSAAATSAQTAVGANSHVISAHLGVVNGFLVYVAHVVDTNNNIHTVIVDAGNGKILSATQLPFANALTQQGGRGIFGYYYGQGTYGRCIGQTFGHHGLNNNLGPQM
jgi:uncharacterized membrane protein YkoI